MTILELPAAKSISPAPKALAQTPTPSPPTGGAAAEEAAAAAAATAAAAAAAAATTTAAATAAPPPPPPAAAPPTSSSSSLAGMMSAAAAAAAAASAAGLMSSLHSAAAAASTSAPSSAASDRYITPEYLAPLPPTASVRNSPSFASHAAFLFILLRRAHTRIQKAIKAPVSSEQQQPEKKVSHTNVPNAAAKKRYDNCTETPRLSSLCICVCLASYLGDEGARDSFHNYPPFFACGEAVRS